MACWLFQAMRVNPQTGQPISIVAPAIESFVLNLPGNLTHASPATKKMAMQQAMAVARAQNLGTPQKVRYGVYLIEPDTDQAQVLCVQPYYGPGAQVAAQQPVLTGQHVNGGMPVGAPVGQPNQNRPDGTRDSSGFQELGDGALGTGSDNVYGAADDGTVSDIYMGGAGGVEVARQ